MDPSFLPPPSTHQPPQPTQPPTPPSVLPPPPLPAATTATVANPTPPTTFNPSHPPYTEMISAAITALKEKDGSSKRAIDKYIEKSYTNLPPTHSALLTSHLKRLKNSGVLVMVKKSYKLPRSDATAAGTASILPPTNDNVINNSNPTTVPPVAHGPKPGRRGRGRPPKSGTNSDFVVEKPKRGPGRPRKSAGPLHRGPTKRRPGRPRKSKTVNGHESQAQVQAQDQLNPVTVSYVTTGANVHVPLPVPLPGVPRPRGRPRKIGTGDDAGGKRRGRPPKTLRNSTGTGRAVGRPRKNLSSALTEAAEAQAKAVADLKRKLEFFQSKVKQAVGVLKPQITSESHISSVAAIQELEGLASMDIINTPLREDPQPPPPQVQS